jgi:hypothetical protein
MSRILSRLAFCGIWAGPKRCIIALWPGRKIEQLGSMNDLSGPIEYRAAIFMKAVGRQAGRGG